MGQTILSELIVALENKPNSAKVSIVALGDQLGRARISIKDFGFKSWLDVLNRAEDVMLDLGTAVNDKHRQLVECQQRAEVAEHQIAECQQWRTDAEEWLEELENILNEALPDFEGMPDPMDWMKLAVKELSRSQQERDRLRAALEVAPIHHYHNCYMGLDENGDPILRECHPDCWERIRQQVLGWEGNR